jgi:hypothetical protein
MQNQDWYLMRRENGEELEVGTIAEEIVFCFFPCNPPLEASNAGSPFAITDVMTTGAFEDAGGKTMEVLVLVFPVTNIDSRVVLLQEIRNQLNQIANQPTEDASCNQRRMEF